MTAARCTPILALLLVLSACGERRLSESSPSAVRPPEAPAMDRPAMDRPGMDRPGAPLGDPDGSPPAPGAGEATEAFDLTEAEWRKRLTPEQFEVTRRKGTERAFTGRYWNTKVSGTYRCVCCGLELFASDAKFDSGCGWPSFTAPVEGESVEETLDTSHGMVRTEITCRRCGAHLGHVFDDGPGPTGLRYCINSASLDLEPRAGSAAKPADEAAGDAK